MFLKKEYKKQSDKINKTRSLVGLRSLDLKKRDCLKCDRIFLSESSNNRLCKECKQNTRRYYRD